jgi:hypothetical protein
MRAWTLGGMVAMAIFALEGPADAQQLVLNGPLDTCDLVLRHYYVPARIEWAVWAAGGVIGTFDRPASLALGIGAEATMGVFRYDGFPARRWKDHFDDEHRNRGELRLGPWGQAETRSAGALVEAGLTMHLGGLNDNLRFPNTYVMFDLRVGAGTGQYTTLRSPHAMIALGIGYRTVFDRLVSGGECDHIRGPHMFADATFARLVLSYRKTTEFIGWEAGLMLEITPTAALIGKRLSAYSYR